MDRARLGKMNEEYSPLDELMADIYYMRDLVLGEARSAEAEKASRLAAREKKKKKAAQSKKRDEKRSTTVDTEKAKKADTSHKGQTDTAEFKNDESFAATPEDSHIHTDGKCDDSSLRHNKPATAYAEVGNLTKNPCDKHYPKFPGKREKARTAGALRQAYAHHDQKAIKELEATAREQGMEPTGATWDERPECAEYQKTGDPSKLPHGKTAKHCKPHGQGGGDEWLRKHHSDSSKAEKGKHGDYRSGHDTHRDQEKHKDVHHEPKARKKGYAGHAKVYHRRHKKAGQLVMPRDISPEEKAFVLGHWGGDASKPGEGGRHGELSRGARRTLSKSAQAERGAPQHGERGEGPGVVRQGAQWHKLSKDKTGKKVIPRP